MYKLIKLVSLSIIGASLASGGHYLLSSLEADSLKALAYGSIFIISTMGVVLDDVFSAYFGDGNGSFLAVISTVITFVFLAGAFRAFTLGESLEGLVLSIGIGLFWVLLLAIYIKLLIAPKQEERNQW
jgi:hypothetical protein